MSAKDKIRLGILGAGFIGKVHANMFSQLAEQVTVQVIADPLADNASKAAEEYGIAEVSADPEAVLTRDDIDAVVLAVPNKLHEPMAVKALETGKHVLLEKPMALTAEQAKRIVRAREASGKVLMMAHQMRFEGINRRVKQLIDAGELGGIYLAKTGWLRRQGIPGWGSWFTRMDEAGGGPLIDIGVHMLDLTLYLMGGAKPVSVYGATYNKLGTSKQGLGDWGTPDHDGRYDVEDIASAIIRLDTGATLTLEVSWAVHLGGGNDPYVQLLGDKGGVSCGNGKATYYTENKAELVDRTLKPLDGELDRFLLSRHFLECIREGKQPHADAMSGLANMLVLDAIYRSSQSGEEVTLDYSL